MSSKWIIAVILGLTAHFSASYIIPLDAAGQKVFLGLLKWVWPWSYGDHGFFGKISQETGVSIIGFFIAAISAGFLIMALLAVLNWWVPFGWWKFLSIIGSIFSLILMFGFFGPAKVIPILFDIFILYLVFSRSPVLIPR